jgi:uncharacterized protein (DUF58 family)
VSASFRLVLALILALIVTGLATLSGGVLVLAIPLIVYLFAAIALRPETVAFTVNRTFTPDHAPQDAPVTVKISLLNMGAAAGELAVLDVLPGGGRVLHRGNGPVNFQGGKSRGAQE